MSRVQVPLSLLAVQAADNQIKLWDLSSAGRASALQAEGHRFEPYRPHSHVCVRNAAVAEQADAQDLKSCGTYTPVPVRFRSAAVGKSERNVEFTTFLLFFLFQKIDEAGFDRQRCYGRSGGIPR